MQKTKIEWVRNPDGTPGYTWSPITGCLNGCSYCYARKVANTRLKGIYLENRLVADPYYHLGNVSEFHQSDRFTDPFYPRFWPKRLNEPAEGCKEKGIFVCSMSDLFGIGVPEDWINMVLRTIKGNDQNRYYLLTKQPQNLASYSPFPDNCWVGVSITNPLSEGTPLAYMRKIKAKIKYISFEPLLSWYPLPMNTYALAEVFRIAGISWVIIGAQTKPTVMPRIEWVKDIVEACDRAGVKVWMKDSLHRLLTDWDFSPEGCEDHDLFFETMSGLRQEMPE